MAKTVVFAMMAWCVGGYRSIAWSSSKHGYRPHSLIVMGYCQAALPVICLSVSVVMVKAVLGKTERQ